MILRAAYASADHADVLPAIYYCLLLLNCRLIFMLYAAL